MVYLCDGGHFLVVSDVPEPELSGRQVGVQQDRRDFYAPFREHDVRTVFVAQAGRPVRQLSWRHDVHRRHGHAHGHDPRVVRPQIVRIVHPYARIVHYYIYI